MLFEHSSKIIVSVNPFPLLDAMQHAGLQVCDASWDIRMHWPLCEFFLAAPANLTKNSLANTKPKRRRRRRQKKKLKKPDAEPGGLLPKDGPVSDAGPATHSS